MIKTRKVSCEHYSIAFSDFSAYAVNIVQKEARQTTLSTQCQPSTEVLHFLILNKERVLQTLSLCTLNKICKQPY